MNAAPVVSIVMAAFNAERWIGASLDSALAQTYPWIEIVVVNDGSTDGTGAVLERYQRERGIRVLTQPNRGQSAAANSGLAAATGHYIKFLDADDILDPRAVAAQVAHLTEKPRHVAYGQWGRFFNDPAEARFEPHPGWHDSDSPVDWLCETWADTEPMYQCALFMIPRKLLERTGGWDERLTLINDFEFFTRLVLASSGIVFTPEARVHYRSSIPGSVSARKTRRAWESACLSTHRAVDHLLAASNGPETRRVSSDILQKLVFAFYPDHADLREILLERIKGLGGSTLPPDGGPGLKKLARLLGWRFAMRLRHALGRRPT